MSGAGSLNCPAKNVVKNNVEKVARLLVKTRHRNMDVSPAAYARFRCRAVSQTMNIIKINFIEFASSYKNYWFVKKNHFMIIKLK